MSVPATIRHFEATAGGPPLEVDSEPLELPVCRAIWFLVSACLWVLLAAPFYIWL